MKRDCFYTLIILALIGLVWTLLLPRLLPVPHKTASVAPVPGCGPSLVGGAAEAPVPGTARPPYVAELQAEIEAREAQLDDLTRQLEAVTSERNQIAGHVQELTNTLNSAIAERNEAIALLQQMGAIQRRPNS